MPRSPDQAFYDKLQQILVDGGFDAYVEKLCQPYYAARLGARSLPPGRYFRSPLKNSPVTSMGMLG